MTDLDRRVAELATEYLPLAASILRECIRIPADYVDRPVDEGGDPLCGLSNHEGPRLEYLKQTIIDIGAVRTPDDVGFDDYATGETLAGGCGLNAARAAVAAGLKRVRLAAPLGTDGAPLREAIEVLGLDLDLIETREGASPRQRSASATRVSAR